MGSAVLFSQSYSASKGSREIPSASNDRDMPASLRQGSMTRRRDFLQHGLRALRIERVGRRGDTYSNPRMAMAVERIECGALVGSRDAAVPIARHVDA